VQCSDADGQSINLQTTPIYCGSGLAREEGVSVDIDIAWHTAFVSKPAPTSGSV